MEMQIECGHQSRTELEVQIADNSNTEEIEETENEMDQSNNFPVKGTVNKPLSSARRTKKPARRGTNVMVTKVGKESNTEEASVVGIPYSNLL